MELNQQDYSRFAKLAEKYGALAGQIVTIADTYRQTHAELEHLIGQKKPGPQKLTRTEVMLDALALLLLTKIEEMDNLESKVKSDMPLPEAHVLSLPPLPAGARF
jgi:hypothetical protein